MTKYLIQDVHSHRLVKEPEIFEGTQEDVENYIKENYFFHYNSKDIYHQDNLFIENDQLDKEELDTYIIYTVSD